MLEVMFDFLCVVRVPVDPQDLRDETVKGKERAILMLGKILAKHDFAEGMFKC